MRQIRLPTAVKSRSTSKTSLLGMATLDNLMQYAVDIKHLFLLTYILPNLRDVRSRVATHINPNTGMTVPDITIMFLDAYIEEDADNYYAVRVWRTDGNDRKIYPKSEWIAEY